MKTKFFTLLFAILASSTLSYAAIVNGECGDNLTWSFNTQDSTLTIEGTGEMTSNPWSEYKQYISYISLPDGLTSIGSYAFKDCLSLTSITIPNSVTSIGNTAFDNCTGLKAMTIGNSVTNIGSFAFRDCTGLTSVTIPNSVTNIEKEAFKGCSSLTSIEISSNVTSIGNGVFKDCAGLTSVTIPQSVTIIEKNAFSSCSSLTSIEIPNKVTSIGSKAFENCSLTSVNIPNSVTSIGSSAFSGCIISSVTCEAIVPPTIGSNTFSDMSIPLFVPEESITAYQNAMYWEEFIDIRAIGSSPLVQFLDWNGTVLSSANVTLGTAATPPADPTREGYTFIGWDKDFSNITEDLVVTAQYKINRYYVQFLDWDNAVLKADSVDWNTAAVAPANPSRDGYDFVGWDKEFVSVTSDLVIKAQYSEGQSTNYSITFVNGQTSEEIFKETLTIKVPAAPEIDGFTFVEWQIVSGKLADGFVVRAIYEADEPTSAPAVYTNPANPAQKLIRNGNVYILTEDKTYTVTGQEVK